MALLDFRDGAVFASSRARGQLDDDWPSDRGDWSERYDRLFRAYHALPYEADEAKRYQIFRALDDSGNATATPARVFDAFRFCTDVNVRGFLSTGLTLETGAAVDGAAESVLTAGEAVWQRSRVGLYAERWLGWSARFGQAFVEATRTSDGTVRLIGWDARNVWPAYDDETGTMLAEVELTSAWHADGAIHHYRRILTPDDVVVELDGKAVPDQSGPHRLGVVPGVLIQWQPSDEPEFGLPAAHGVEGCLRRMDSAITEIAAIANRYAIPWTVIRGFKIGSSSDVGRLGRVLDGVPVDGGVEHITEGADAIPHLLATIEACRAEIQQRPEYVFTEGGSGESGEARSYKAAAFESQVEAARRRILPEIARATGYAVAMEQGDRADEDAEVYAIDAGPVLPRNLARDVKVLADAAGDLTRADRVRHLQRLGLASTDMSVEDYVIALGDETAARAVDFFRRPAPPAAE